VPTAVPLVILATIFTVPAPVALALPFETDAPAAVLPEPKLHVIVLFVALIGATVPLSITGVPAMPVEDTPVMPVTGTKSFDVVSGQIFTGIFLLVFVPSPS